MATVSELPNGFRVLDFNWIISHGTVFLQTFTQGEFYFIFPRVDVIAPKDIRVTLCRGTVCYTIPVSVLATSKQIPLTTWPGRNVKYWVTDAGSLRTLRIQITRTSSPANEVWDTKIRVMLPVGGISDWDCTEQYTKSNVDSIEVIA